MIYINSLSHTHTQTHKGWSMLQCLNAFIASKRRLYSPLWVKENRKRVTGGGFVYVICVALCEAFWNATSVRKKLHEGVTYLFVICSIYRLYLVVLPLTYASPITGWGWHPAQMYLLEFCFHGCVSVAAQDFLILLLVSKTSRQTQLHNMGLPSVLCFISIWGILWAMWFWFCSK